MTDLRKRRRPPTAGRAATRATDRAAAAAAPGQRVTLPRALSKLGHCSRKEAEALILSGRVWVDGRRVTDISAWVDLERAAIRVDGERLAAAPVTWLMLNKPRGLLTTRQDPDGRPTVYSCLDGQAGQHLSPVGRLDKASEGLLLFTNDTRLAQALLDPETHVAKRYHVQIDRIADDAFLQALEAGVEEGGEHLRALSARRLREGGRNSWLEITLDEGRNRQIRRMLAALDTECLRLVRVAIGPLVLGDLAKGAVRPLSEAEVTSLRALATHSPN